MLEQVSKSLRHAIVVGKRTGRDKSGKPFLELLADLLCPLWGVAMLSSPARLWQQWSRVLRQQYRTTA